jgi:hypothetical protein
MPCFRLWAPQRDANGARRATDSENFARHGIATNLSRSRLFGGEVAIAFNANPNWTGVTPPLASLTQQHRLFTHKCKFNIVNIIRLCKSQAGLSGAAARVLRDDPVSAGGKQ